ncbi:hypothetical protein [Dokdonella soli]|uniref:CSLREA domain-containing protein n=1 Tax=Dokdonella soli TaxID=529810 RepID=A0ABN1IF98_9GAMM
MATRVRITACWTRWLLAALTLLSVDAPAICLPIPHYRYVGNVAGDATCTDNDIQSAINNATCPGTTILITNERTYTSQALTIFNKSLALVGVGAGVPCGHTIGICDPSIGCGGGGGGPPPAPAVTLHGTGSTSVIFIYGGGNVTLQSLKLTGGGGSQGGGILFGGYGSLTVVDSSIVNNSASNGGGIFFSGLGGNATLTLGAGTIIEENTATIDGGGIYLAGATRLLALAPYTFIGYNHTPNGNGGGILMAGPPPAQADIGSPGYNGAPVIEFNDAAYGGGIALVAQGPENGVEDVRVNLFATDPNHPGAISNNSATQAGGGIYLKPNWDLAVPGPIYALLCATNFRIDGNVAPEGSAIYADYHAVSGTITDAGAVQFNPSSQCYDYNYGASLASLGGVNCAAGVACNTVNNNGSLDASSQPTAGAALFINRAGYLDARRFTMRFNQGGHAIRLVGGQPANVIDCLLADNTQSAELIRAENTDIDIDSCTLANNSLGGASVIYNTTSGNSFYDTLQDSIIDQPGLVTLNSGTHIGVSYVLSNDISTIPFGGTQGTPTFVNAAAGDYHLQITSLGVDFAPPESYPAGTEPSVDLDGMRRVFDIPTVPNVHGPRDLGDYERVPACYRPDTMFCDGFDAMY